MRRSVERSPPSASRPSGSSRASSAGGNHSWSGSSQGSEVILFFVYHSVRVLESVSRRAGRSETRCGYVLVRLATPSMASHSFRTTRPPASSGSCVACFQSALILLIQKLFSIQCSHATEACGGHGLAVNVVGYVAGGEYARYAALGGHAFQARADFDVAAFHV